MSTERKGQVLMLCSLSRSCDLRTHKRVACHVPHLPVRGPPGYPRPLCLPGLPCLSQFAGILGVLVASWRAMSLTFRHNN